MEIGISLLHPVGISEMIFSNFDNNEILICILGIYSDLFEAGTVKDGTVRVGTVKAGTVKDGMGTVRAGTVKAGTMTAGTVKAGIVNGSQGRLGSQK